MSFKEYWGGQFGNPTGVGGKIVTFLMNRMNRAMYKVLLQEVRNNTKVLDIGFGNGYMLKRLLKVSGSSFYGIDISSDMVRTVIRKNKKSIEKNRLNVSKSSVDSIPFEESFGQVYTINTIYFWDDLLTGFKEIFNRLESGGEFLNVCYTKRWLDKLSYTKNYKKYEEEEILKVIKQAGFTAEIVPIKKGKSFFIKAKKP